MIKRATTVFALLFGGIVPLLGLAQETGMSSHGGTETPASGESSAAAALQATLYDVIALRFQVQQAHWNIVGDEFYQLHDVTGDFYEALDELVDTLGEQRLTLGHPSTAVVTAVAEHADLPRLPSGYLSEDQLIESLGSSYQRLADNLGSRIVAAGEAGDFVSQDVLIGVAALINKQRWIIQAHVEDEDDEDEDNEEEEAEEEEAEGR